MLPRQWPGGRVVDEHGRLQAVFAVHIAGGYVWAIHNVVNPDKLGHVGPLADAWAFAREAKQARRAGN